MENSEKAYGLDNKFNNALVWINLWKEARMKVARSPEEDCFRQAIIKSLDSIIHYLASKDPDFIVTDSQIFNEVKEGCADEHGI